MKRALKSLLLLIFLSAGFLSFETTVAKTSVQIIHASSPETKAQVAYAKKHYDDPNAEGFGDLGLVDCANFTSQTLLARGWEMTPEWGAWKDDQGQQYTRAWISSTAFMECLEANPQLATPLTWQEQNKVSVGDIVQFDWDNSGDRDHTTIVSSILVKDHSRLLLLAQHSPSGFNFPITAAIAKHGPTTKVYFWHLKKSS